MLTADQIDFEKSGGLVPAIIQDAVTKTVLMLGYMNAESFAHTLDSGRVTFFSRSKNRLWTKGESSGHFLQFHDAKLDCDSDALLIRATPIGPTCHTGADTCWNETNAQDPLLFLRHLETVIHERKSADPSTSYTARLFKRASTKLPKKWAKKPLKLSSKPKTTTMIYSKAKPPICCFILWCCSKPNKFRLTMYWLS